MTCRYHLTQLRQRKDEIDSLGLKIKIVTFDADFLAMAYAKKSKLTWPLLLDEEQQLYEAYGMKKASWWAIYKPVSIWKYLKLMLVGQMPWKMGKDWRQLGGDVLIDPNGDRPIASHWC